MVAILLILLNVAIYVIQKFWVKRIVGKRLISCGTFISFGIWGYHYGTSDFLKFHIWYLIAVLLIAYTTFLLSMFIVGTKYTKENMLPFSCFRIKGKIKAALIKESLSNLYSSTYEELLFRWLFMNALIELIHIPWVAILVTILAFFFVHLRNKKIIVHMIDIFTFSVIITIWFYYTINPIYSIIIHILRNQLVICQKYVFIMTEQRKKQKYYKLLKEKP